MSSTFKPSSTRNATGNQIAAGSLAANTAESATVDLTGIGASGTGSATGAYEGSFLVSSTPGSSVATTNGLQIQCFEGFGATPTFATVATFTYTIPSVASTLASYSFRLPTGLWKITLTNLDTTNAISSVSLTNNTIDSITSSP